MNTANRASRGSGAAMSIMSIAIAALATQHHTVHMLILMLGAGSAGMSFMEAYPLIRRAMLLISLLMVGVMVIGLRRQRSFMRLMTGFSIVLTLGLVAWSVLQFGV